MNIMNPLRTFSVLIVLIFCFSCGSSQEEKPTPKEPLNIILMIGDGMGVPQITSSFYFKSSPPNFERF